MAMPRSPRLRKEDLTAEMVRNLFSYDPDDGIFRWKNPTANSFKPGDNAGSLDSRGYVVLRIFYQRYSAHRVAWLYMFGAWPTQIDHKDGDKSNNRIGNLREVTSQQNSWNAVNRGYCYKKRDKRYCPEIMIDGRTVYLGRYKTAEEAIAVHREAHTKLAGEYSFYNRQAGGQAPEYAARLSASTSPGDQR